MGFLLIRDGKTIERPLEGTRTLAEILSDDEYQRLQEGSLVAFTASGGLMSLDSPLQQGQTVVLRPLQPERDLAAFGFPINRMGETVGISELIAIRRYEESHKIDIYEHPLQKIRQLLHPDTTQLLRTLQTCFEEHGHGQIATRLSTLAEAYPNSAIPKEDARQLVEDLFQILGNPPEKEETTRPKSARTAASVVPISSKNTPRPPPLPKISAPPWVRGS